MPVSARVSAGASLMPSPTIATRPRFCSSRMTASFPSGSTPATTRSTPACFPMALAVRSLSPVSITTSMPIFCSCFTACAESGLITSATAMMPRSVPSSSKYSGVLPCSASASAFSARSAGMEASVAMNRPDPPCSTWPSSFPTSPLPDSAAKSVTSSPFCPAAAMPACRPAAAPHDMPSACAPPASEYCWPADCSWFSAFSASFSTCATIARASGCSLFFSSAYALRRSSLSETPSAGIRSVTSG